MEISNGDIFSYPPTSSPPFAFSHPLVYATRVQDRVQALDLFIRRDLAPKILRLRKEIDRIEYQHQRTMTKRNEKSCAKRQTPKDKIAQRLKNQAWLWKRSSKRQELNRLEPFLRLATDLRKISSDLNPNILRLTVLWQRSQSIAPLEHVAADDSVDVVYNDETMNESGFGRRYREQQRLSREYRDACLENIRVSKSIQKRINKLLTSDTISLDDASVLSSLRIFSNKHCICSSCQAIFHKDYLDALVISIPEKTDKDSDIESTFLCLHCWNSTRTQRHRQKSYCRKQSCESSSTKNLASTSKKKDVTKSQKKEFQSTPKTQRMKQLFDATRYQTIVKVVENSMAETAESRSRKSSYDRKTDDIHKVADHQKGNTKDNSPASSSAFDHCIVSMASLDDGLSAINDSFSSCSILGEYDQEDASLTFHPLRSLPLPFESKSALTERIIGKKVNMHSSVVSKTYDKTKTDVRTGNESFGRFGSSSSSICSNSIAEPEQENPPSRRSSDSDPVDPVWYKMNDRSVASNIRRGKNKLRNEYLSPDPSTCSSSLFSESSAETTIFSSVSTTTPKHIKSAMKKACGSSSSSTSGISPNKVNQFPFCPSNTKKSVRFRSPLKECKIYNPMSCTDSNKAFLDSSSDFMDQVEYFCKWDEFMNPLERQPHTTVF